MFEVEDLAVASPATVSRCGMVFLEPILLGYECIVVSYCNSVKELLGKNYEWVC
jgi:dynein heavy chain